MGQCWISLSMSWTACVCGRDLLFQKPRRAVVREWKRRRGFAGRTDIHRIVEQRQHRGRWVCVRQQRQRRQEDVRSPKLHDRLQQLARLRPVIPAHASAQRPDVAAATLDLSLLHRPPDRSEAARHTVARVAARPEVGRQVLVARPAGSHAQGPGHRSVVAAAPPSRRPWRSSRRGRARAGVVPWRRFLHRRLRHFVERGLAAVHLQMVYRLDPAPPSAVPRSRCLKSAASPGLNKI
jgi:hypothetical protein